MGRFGVTAGHYVLRPRLDLVLPCSLETVSVPGSVCGQPKGSPSVGNGHGLWVIFQNASRPPPRPLTRCSSAGPVSSCLLSPAPCHLFRGEWLCGRMAFPVLSSGSSLRGHRGAAESRWHQPSFCPGQKRHVPSVCQGEGQTDRFDGTSQGLI